MSKKLDPCWLCSQASRTTPSNGGVEGVEEILQKLELSEYRDVFEKERMDRQALVRSSLALSCVTSSLCFPILPPSARLPGTESLAHEASLGRAAGAELQRTEIPRWAHTSLLRY